MSRNTKIILLIVSSLAFLCICVCATVTLLVPRMVENTFSRLSTPEVREAQAKSIGAQIADYTLPPGYTEEMGMDLFIEKILMLGPSDKHGPSIMLLQVNSPNTSREQMEEQMRQAFANQFSGSGAYEPAGEHTVTVKGQPMTLTVLESNRDSAYAMRQAEGVFQGKGGIVMVMIMGDVEEWDWKIVDDFFASIR